MFRHSFRKSLYAPPARFAAGIALKPQKVGDKTHFETAIVASGQFLNTANVMLGAFCKENEKEHVAIFNDKSRPAFHEFSKDLHAQISYKDEAATGKILFEAPAKGLFYKIDSDPLKIDPDNNKIILQDKVFTYDHLVLAGEYLFGWDKVKGMEEAIGDYWNSNVVTTAQVHTAEMVWRASLDFRGGNFVYALPKSPYKNEGTTHVFAFYDQLVRDRKVEGQWYDSKFIITTPDTFIHRVPWVNQQLLELAAKKGIEIRYNLQLVEIKYSQMTDAHRVSDAVYVNTLTGQQEVINYGSLVCYPEAKIPESVKPFSDSTGHVDVNPYTLNHVKYPNIFAIGEITNLPTVSNPIGILNQAKVVAGNLKDLKKGMDLHYHYDGTSATPIFVGWHKLIVPGFKYEGQPVSTYLTTDTTSPFAGIKQSITFQLFKRYEKKWMTKRLKGKIYGPPKWTKYVKPAQPVLETSKH
jgi:sulfide:quinone oxidoreductase